MALKVPAGVKAEADAATDGEEEGEIIDSLSGDRD